MSIKIFIPDDQEEYGQPLVCYELETREVYLYEIETWRHMGGDMYERHVTKEPRAYSYEAWCREGIEHSQEQKDEDILVYRRKVMIEGSLHTFDTAKEFLIFLEKLSPIKIELDTYFLKDGTPLIGVSEYYDY